MAALKNTKKTSIIIGIVGLLGALPMSAIAQNTTPQLTLPQLSAAPDNPDLAEAARLNQQAEKLYIQGQYAAATPLAQRALAIREQVLANNHPLVAQSLNILGLLYQVQGQYTLAEPLLQRALAIREQVLGSNHPDVASSLNILGLLYQAQGKYTPAEPLLQRALAIREQVLGNKHPLVAKSLNDLAFLYRDQGKYTLAEPLFQRAIAIDEQALGANHPNVATTLNNLAILYQDQGKYALAEPLFQRALTIFEQALGANHPDVAVSLTNLATLYQKQGKYPLAEPLFQRALTIFVQALGANHPHVAANLNALAILSKYQGKYAQAESFYQRALAILEKVLGTNHPSVATSLNNLASLYREYGKYAQAEPLYQRSLAIREQVLGGDHPDVATSLNNLATLYDKQGKYAQAESLLQRALTIFKKALGADNYLVGLSLHNLGLLYYAQGKYAQAEPLYQKALAIFEQALGAEHPDVAANLNNLAVVYQSQGNIQRTIEILTRSTSIEEQNLAINLTAGSEADKLAYISTIYKTTNLAVSLHLQLVRNNLAANRLAFTTILQRKGRVLDALADSGNALRRHLTPENQVLLDELAANRAQLSALIFNKPPHLSSEQYRQEVIGLKIAGEKLEVELSRRSIQFLTTSQPVTIAAVQKLIPADTVLVELVLYYPYNPQASISQPWGKPRYAAYILPSQGEPESVDLGEVAPINQAWQQFRLVLTDVQKGTTTIKAKARALDALLMQPIRQKLGKSRHILLSPDSQLNIIPFGALVDEKNQYLVENYLITYLTAGRDLLRLSQHSPSQENPVLIANPDFDNSGSSSVNATASSERSSDLAKLQFGALPGTAEEAKTISPLLSTVKLLTGSQATENALKQVKSPRILHIATHGFFLKDLPMVALPNIRGGIAVEPIASNTLPPGISNPENPLLRSGIALAGFNLRQSGNEDGVLTALEAAGLNLYGTKLVALSACETGLGDATNGDGVYGLRRAFVIAGAESQLMSMWKVSDFGTKELMLQYYQRLLKGEGRSEALRQTQLEMLYGEKYKHPYYWAAFIPAGDWTPTQF